MTSGAGIAFVKAHAYGNDFLLVEGSPGPAANAVVVARAVCDRHHGVGGDGVIFYHRTTAGARMTLLNADGTPAEVSGNGVRCLAALLADETHGGEPSSADRDLVVETDGGVKTLTLLDAQPPRYTFRADMGQPDRLEQRQLEVGGRPLSVVTLSVGNPQCVVLTETLDDELLRRLGPALTAHEAFRDGTNVELVQVARPDRLRILIWERGVGPTEASGTGACASAVAAAAYGGAARTVEVTSPGGTQRVEWTSDGIYLTGWAELSVRGRWVNPPSEDAA